MVKVDKIQRPEPDLVRDRVPFDHLTPLFPDEKFKLCKGGYSDPRLGAYRGSVRPQSARVSAPSSWHSPRQVRPS